MKHLNERKEKDVKPVLTKRDFVQRYQTGEFGNASPTWQTFSEYLASGYSGLVHFRNRIAGGPTYYNVAGYNAKAVWVGIKDKHNFYISAMAPSNKTLLQGEVQRSIRYLDLTYTKVPKAMREALAACTQHASGIMAVELLRRYMCANSYAWLQVLLTRYPNHVIEFSSYSVQWGTLPGHNTVFWECRRY